MTDTSPTRQIDWEERTSGRLQYVDDVSLPGMLIARILRSNIPHGRIRSLDTSAAEQLPGVHAVITANDFGDRTYIHLGGKKADRHPLARDRVRFVREEIAAVAAETTEQADAAVDAIQLRMRRLRQVTDVWSALRSRSANLHGRPSGHNVSVRIERTYGDTPQGDAAFSVGGSYRYQPQAHACMEPNSVIASWDSSEQVLDIWASTQAPYFVQKEVAHVLSLQLHQVRVREIGVGGGFGAKSKICEIEALAAALSMKAGRPVKLVLTRQEEFSATKPRHEFLIDLESSASSEGKLLGRRAKVTVDNGAYNHTGPSVMGAGTTLLAALYRTEGVAVSATLVDTNKVPGGQFRGYGGAQATFALESQIDELAAAAGWDPLEFRLRNVNRSGDVTHAGQKLVSCRLEECLTKLRKEFDWDERRKAGGNGRGVGVAIGMHASGSRGYEDANRAEAEVEVDGDGEVRVYFGSADAGTGQSTVLAEVVGREFGQDPSSIRVTMMDTETTPFDMGAWSSRGTVMAGHAAGRAARGLAGTMKQLAADKFGCAPSSVEIVDGEARAADESISLGELAQSSDGFDGSLRCRAEFIADTDLRDEEKGVANTSPTYSFAAQAVEVEVDRETGKVTVLDAIAVHDSGLPLNPIGFEGQIVGGVAMGLGAALGEEVLYEDGRVLNPSFLNYPLPRAADLPRIRAFSVNIPDPAGPYGAKGVGEIAMEPIAPAVANAIYHAVGVRLRELPLTPDKVLAAIQPPSSFWQRTKRFQLWRRPSRWQISLFRAAYPYGMHHVLHRIGTRFARQGGPRRIEEVVEPQTLDEALDWLAEPTALQPLSGGTDLLPAVDQGLAKSARLLDVSDLAEFRQVHGRDDRSVDLYIGGSVTLAETIDLLDPVRDRGLREALLSIASEQIRQVATVAGNLCQEKRCWFYRNEFDCYKRGGATCPCYAVDGDHRFFHAAMDAHRCQAVTPSDLGTMLAALGAKIDVVGPKGRRNIAAESLYSGPGETALKDQELIAGVIVPASARGQLSAFKKLRLVAGDFAIVSAAVCGSFDHHGAVKEARVVLGSLAPTPFRAHKVERCIVGHRSSKDRMLEASRVWQSDAHPLRQNEWKINAAAGVLDDALTACFIDSQVEM